MKFVLQCLNHFYPSIELNTEKGTRLGPPISEAPFSRVEAYPDYTHGKIRIRNLGPTKCLINFHHVLRHGEETFISPGEIVDLTFGTFVYQARVGMNSKLMPTTLADDDEDVDNHTIVTQSTLSNKPTTDGPKSHQSKRDSSTQQNGNGSSQSLKKVSGPNIRNASVADAEEERREVESVVSSTDSGMLLEDSSMAILSQVNEDGTMDSSDAQEGPINGPAKIQDSDWNTIQGRLGKMPVLLYGGEDLLKYKPKIAGFDLDLTIIQPSPRKSGVTNLPIIDGKVVARSLWQFLYPNTVSTLRQFMSMHPDHKLMVVTNKASAGFNISKSIIEEVAMAVDIPMIVFAAKEGTEFLKPAPFVWSVYCKFYNEGRDPDWSNSFFCGDCAGRLKDISMGDRLFAMNASANFMTPEEFFQGTPTDAKSILMPSFNPAELCKNGFLGRVNNDHIQYKSKVEIILMCGILASGKTRFVETVLLPRGYVHIHPCPEMSTVKARLELISSSISAKKSVVVDRRNIDKEERTAYIRVANSLHIPIRCFQMNVTESHSRHNLRFHELRTAKLFNAGEVELSLRRHKALFETPTAAEGFDEIVHVNFIPNTFLSTNTDLELYSKFLYQR